MDFQEILQKSSIFHNSSIEKHLCFLSKKKRKNKAISCSKILLNKIAIVELSTWRLRKRDFSDMEKTDLAKSPNFSQEEL